MKFGSFYELEIPRPWEPGKEQRIFREGLEQVELADRLGFDSVWATEHHFLEEYAHSSAPEVFLAACSQRTKRIRLGHGVTLLPLAYNHPARVAERIATLDLVSEGRVEFGTAVIFGGRTWGVRHQAPGQTRDVAGITRSDLPDVHRRAVYGPPGKVLRDAAA